ncbi:MAG: M3 family oligoendopeptidase [Acholeplasmataceae bacterium]
MNNKWSLDSLYKGFDSKYQNDLDKLDLKINEYITFLDTKNDDDINYLETYLKYNEEILILIRTLGAFASLRQATDVADYEALTYLAKISNIARKTTKADVRFNRYLKDLDLDNLANKSNLINHYLYNLKREQNNANYLLSEKEEELYSKMQELSSSSWSQIHNLATANLMIEINGKEHTFSDVRNMAYDKDPKVRKDAYLAELEAYKNVDDYVAIALSNIKREVNTINDLRGYKDALSKTLIQSKIKKETLDAMLSAMHDYKDDFANYLKAKAKYLGHQNGLPFYDLFAPVGSLSKTYTFKEAKSLTKDAFSSYSKSLSDFADKAFKNNWIDPFPKKGKRGGAFCSNLPQINESRIMLNFTGSLDDIMTLAHELGHGYHGDIIKDNSPLHWSYPMPLAETASIFCETIMKEHLLTTIDNDDEKLSILELGLQGDTQVIIDILSRYLFETKLLNNANRPISKNELNTWMLEAQKEAYLDGLDHNYLHQYMWLVKGHYYSAGLNFYNFPYAFGLLFGKGLYAIYLKDKNKFLNDYDNLLKLTTKMDAEDVALKMGIDLTKKDFWLGSLKMIKKDIDLVTQLLSKK